MEYNNIYKGNGEVIRVPKPPRQGPPVPVEGQDAPAAEPIPARSAEKASAGASPGDLLLMAVLLLLWIERRDEDALLTLVALLMI
ncbi:MAG: hypothetical protein LBD85_02770 [Oscillospiraceae bacterium]|jgi:hypothetical protein|nr:hypothetical protein [Oscillospiraceae bacterium]